jgi:hypothetical protein
LSITRQSSVTPKSARTFPSLPTHSTYALKPRDASLVHAAAGGADGQEARRTRVRLAGSRWVESGYVFTSTIGTPIDDRKILTGFSTLVKAVKLPKQRFHDLRHARISLLGAQGVPLKVIADIVGHSDIRLTQNVYQRVYQEARRDAVDKMEVLLSNAAKAPENRVATKVAAKTPLSTLN